MRPPALAVALLSAAVTTAGFVGAEPPEPGELDRKDTLEQTVVSHRLEVKLKGPAEVAYDPARLGHVAIQVRITIRNRSGAPVPLEPKGVRISAVGARARYACESTAERERWPQSIAPGEELTSDRLVVCETTLPGRHDLELRWADDPDTAPPVTTTTFTLAAGPRGPVRLVSRPELLATASGSGDVRPSQQPGKVRIVLGIVNAGQTVTTLSAMEVTITLRQRGRTFFCQDRRIVDLRGVLGAGKMHVIWLPLACAVPYEGEWDTTVDIGEPRTPSVRLQSHVVHVREVPPVP